MNIDSNLHPKAFDDRVAACRVRADPFTRSYQLPTLGRLQIIGPASWQIKSHNPDHNFNQLDNMSSVEPGTYRIVNFARNKAIRVPDEDPDTIASWQTQDEANQKVSSIDNYSSFSKVYD